MILKSIWQLVIYVKDKSIDNLPNFFELYIFTFDDNPKVLFL